METSPVPATVVEASASASVEASISLCSQKTARNEIKHRIEYRNQTSKDSTSFDKSEFQTPDDDHEPVVMEYFDVRLTRDKNSTEQGAEAKRKAIKETGTGHPYIRILSPAVNEALRCVVDYYPSLTLHAEIIEVPAPYAVFFHYEKELNEYRERLLDVSTGTPDSTCANRYAAEHIQTVQEWVKARYQTAVDAERALHAKGRATFDMLWLLFKPGEDIYLDSHRVGECEPSVMKGIDFEIENGTVDCYICNIWNIDADSTDVGPCSDWIRILRWPGEKDVHALQVFPCTYLRYSPKVTDQDVEDIRQHFIDRGRKWYNLRRKTACYSFDGVTRYPPRRNVSGFAMVDPVQYPFRSHDLYDADNERGIIMSGVEQTSSALNICSCKRCEKLIYSKAVKPRFSSYGEVNPILTEELTDHQYFLCDSMVEAFMFKTRSWERLHVSGFKDPIYDESLFSRLVMKPETKDLIRDLTTMYIRGQGTAALQDEKPYMQITEVHKERKHKPSQDTWSADFIQGKGEGLTFLLHGKPGVGKTYTAECIANFTKRPLLTLTCADIGVSPKDIEASLLKWFKLAERWGAIMLIDEADIYMEQRQAADIERNHLVAGFLRALEYFKGILFLTTNRVGAFDEAFISRIQMKLFYSDFTDDDREKVWNTFFDKLEDDREASMKIPEKTREYIQSQEMMNLKWNGREIRNAFQVAVALAEAQGEMDKENRRIIIKREHLKATVQMSREFRDYLIKLHKTDLSKRAANKGDRFDAFDSTAPRTPRNE